MLKSTGRENLLRKARAARDEYYRFLDAGGTLLFLVLRCVRIIPKIEPFDPNKVLKIMVVRADRIGDLVLSTPSFAALRQRFPNAYISLIVRTVTKDLVVENPMIDEVIDFDHNMPIANKIRFLLNRKHSRYDLAIVLHSTFWWCLLTYISGAVCRIGYKGKGGGFLLTNPIPPRKGDDKHELENTLNIVRFVGADVKEKLPYVCVTRKGEDYAKNFFDDNCIGDFDTIVAIHPGARQEYIRWQKEGFAALADMIIEKYAFRILVIGGASEKSLVRDVHRRIKDKKFVVSACDMTLTELVSLIKRCALFVGNSTGPMHIAAALGVPVVAIFGSIHPSDSYNKWGPWGEGHIVVSKNLNCYDCHPSDCENMDCMRLIEPEEVMCAVTKQIEKTIK